MTLRIIIFIFFGVCAAHGQNPDKFWTKSRVAWTAAHATAASYDVWTTRRGLANGFREANPLMRPFVTRGTAGQVGAVGISLALDLGLSYLFHRRWPALKNTFPVTFALAHGIAGTRNHILVHGRTR